MELILEMLGPNTPADASETKKKFTQSGGAIGRAEDCYWIIPDRRRLISGHHAKIEWIDGVFYIIDLSSNGTILKETGNRLPKGEAIEIKHGQVFVIGNLEIQAHVPHTAGEIQAHVPHTAGEIQAHVPHAARKNQAHVPHAAGEIQAHKPDSTEDAAGEINNSSQNHVIPDSQSNNNVTLQRNIIPDNKFLDDAFMIEPDPIDQLDLNGLSHEPQAQESSVNTTTTHVLNSSDADHGHSNNTHVVLPVADISNRQMESVIVPEFSSPTPTPDSMHPSQSDPIKVHENTELGADSTNVFPMGISASFGHGRAKDESSQRSETRVKPQPTDFWGLFAEALNINMQDLSLENKQIVACKAARLLNLCVSHLQQSMRTRSELKDELRLPLTVAQNKSGNPLKYGDSSEAMQALLIGQKTGQPPSEQAITRAYRDLQSHQVALLAGTKAVMNAALDTLSPEQLMLRFQREGKLKIRTSGGYWRAYTKLHDVLTKDGEWGARLFAREFSQTYEEQVKLINALDPERKN